MHIYISLQVFSSIASFVWKPAFLNFRVVAVRDIDHVCQKYVYLFRDF